MKFQSMFQNAFSLLIIHLFEGILESCTEFKMNKWNCTRFKINMKITHKRKLRVPSGITYQNVRIYHLGMTPDAESGAYAIISFFLVFFSWGNWISAHGSRWYIPNRKLALLKKLRNIL